MKHLMQKKHHQQRDRFLSLIPKKSSLSILLMALPFYGVQSAHAEQPSEQLETTSQSAVINQIGQQQWNSVSEAINNDIEARQMNIQLPEEGSSHYRSRNVRHGWQTDYTLSGKTQLTIPTKQGSENHISSQLVDWGYEGSTRNHVSQPTDITTTNNQLNYHWSASLTERWTNTAKGTEQWFIINQRPEIDNDNNASPKLSVRVALDSNLMIEQNNQSLSFYDESIRIDYEKLKVWDSRGKILAASMQLNDNTVTLSVDDKNAVYPITIDPVFTTQEAYIKASNTDVISRDTFGYSVALSADGNTLAVGAKGEQSNATGINVGAVGEANNDLERPGAVYVFTRTGTIWNQQAYIKASITGSGDSLGYSVALSADGNTLAVGALGQGGPNSVQPSSGAVYTFARNGTTWTQTDFIKASNSGRVDFFGHSVALSADGNTLAGGATKEASNATGINGTQGNNAAPFAGAVYVFRTNVADISVETALTTAAPYTTGQTVTYSISVTNNGPNGATNVVVTDTPDNLTVTAVSGAGCSALPCTIPSLANGASEVITVTATIVAAGNFGATTSVKAQETDLKQSNNKNMMKNVASNTPTPTPTPTPSPIPSLGVGLLATMFGFITLLYRRKSQLFVK